ncbi:ABC transporter substrate-binding protein [Mesorhizobium sp. LHD-90]|uniref:ABC transporter substrate-binding protein n=1 Tax=Mesorhizobium sp. LHD-90 TaxID=3071414 RepID=UPI0027E0887B|nr:ABC transporter substrate-binding protein [Mesorhizobium sp. LHD-90]MDQ6438113.1 ABC transporter substrate-binding protein [Mesorhizobium sp. LHD-90]
MQIIQNRRTFVAGAAAAGAASFLGTATKASAEPPPETTRIRLIRIPSICQAPQYVAEELLRSEGFTDVQFIPKRGTADIAPALASSEVDLSAHFAAPLLLHLEAGDPIVVLAGLHVGCFELFGTDRVQAIRDLKGKTVAVPSLDSSRYVFLASMTAYVGLDIHKDINFVTHQGPESMQLLSEGKIDAYLGFPPEPQEMREQRIGHVVISSTADRPWSQYFCCMLAGNREFVRANPVATKRALRAILKAADFCASEPEQSAQFLVEQGYTKRYDHALQVMKAIPYGWREYSAEDTLRFYALRLHEVGMLKSSPQELMAQGTDWRFLDEIKHELKI